LLPGIRNETKHSCSHPLPNFVQRFGLGDLVGTADRNGAGRRKLFNQRHRLVNRVGERGETPHPGCSIGQRMFAANHNLHSTMSVASTKSLVDVWD
jgi:hypothetical protein